MVTADGKTFALKASQVQATFSPSKKMKADTDPSEILAGYLEVAKAEPLELGVDPEMLEMAWELAAEQEASALSASSILQVIDEKLCSGPLEKYRAYKLMTSDLGKVFFKTVGNKYKAKAAKAVQASKQAFCAHVTATKYQDFCFV